MRRWNNTNTTIKVDIYKTNENVSQHKTGLVSKMIPWLNHC